MELTPKQALELVDELRLHMKRLDAACLQRARDDEAFQRFLAVAFYRYV